MEIYLTLYLLDPNKSHHFLFTSFSSNMDCKYKPMFGRWEYGSDCLSCSTSLLGGVPLGSWNASLYVYKISFTRTSIFPYILPTMPPLLLILCHYISTPRKVSCSSCLILLTLILVEHMKVMPKFPLCALMIKYSHPWPCSIGYLSPWIWKP